MRRAYNNLFKDQPGSEAGSSEKERECKGRTKAEAYLGKSGGLDGGGGCGNPCCLESVEDKEIFFFPHPTMTGATKHGSKQK